MDDVQGIALAFGGDARLGAPFDGPQIHTGDKLLNYRMYEYNCNREAERDFRSRADDAKQNRGTEQDRTTRGTQSSASRDVKKLITGAFLLLLLLLSFVTALLLNSGNIDNTRFSHTMPAVVGQKYWIPKGMGYDHSETHS